MEPAEDVDPERIDWSRVRSATYRIEQTLTYEYESPISELRQRLVIAPRVAHGDQLRLSHRLTSSANAPWRSSLDLFGNAVAEQTVARIERSIAFSLESVVRRTAAPPPAVTAAPHAAWRDVRRLVRPDAALQSAADLLHGRHLEERARAEAIVHFVHGALTYTKGVTDVFTTASVAYSMRRGVCQDFAHVAIALARASGLHARYVSGHLLGEGATHAWVEFVVRERSGKRVVVSFDPTHGRPTDLRYVTVAIGRDYEDVAPTSGVFIGAAPGRLFGVQRVRLTEIAA